MSGASSRRTRRTAKPPSKPKIEREKIRHRRPKDLDFAEDDEVGFPQAAGPEDGMNDREVYVEEVDLDWTVHQEDPSGLSDWEDDSDDDWTLDNRRNDQRFSEEEELEEEGVIWEEDAFADPDFFHPGDQYAYRDETDRFDDAPGFEPAGRRNARSRAPRPAPPPRPQGKQHRPPPRQRRSAPGGWDEQGQPPHFQEPLEQDVAYGAPRRAGARPSRATAPPGVPPLENGRFARTLAATGVVDDSGRGRVMPPPQQPPQQQARGRRGPRHHPTPPPTVPLSRKERRQFAARYSKGRGRGQGVFIATVFFLIIGISWLAYQAISPNGGQPLLERLSSLTSMLPFPSTTRNAADTSFDTQATPAERALSDLVESSRQNGDNIGLPPGPNGPPIPEAKPQSGDQSQLTVIDDEPETPSSALDQLLRFINPG